MTRMRPEDIRRWDENHRAAAKRVAQDARRNPLTPAAAFAAALELLRWDEIANGSPFARHDPISDREDEQMWNTWATLRARWGRGR